MLTLIFMFIVLCGLLVFLTIWDTIASFFNPKMILGGVVGYLIAKHFQNKGDQK